MNLDKLGKRLNVKFEILNEEQLNYLRDYGCRILEICSSIHSNDGRLCIEGKNGELIRLDSDQLYDKLVSRDGQPLNIDVVFVNVLNGQQIANVFIKLGVPQVFTFNSTEPMTTGIQSSFEYHSMKQTLFMKDFTNGIILRLG